MLFRILKNKVSRTETRLLRVETPQAAKIVIQAATVMAAQKPL